MKNLPIMLALTFLLSSCTSKNSLENMPPTTFNLTPTVIQENGHPDKYLIQTNFVPQAPEKNWDQPWQDACEEASILTLHYYYTKSTPTISDILLDYQKIFDYENNLKWPHDINLEKMSILSRDLFSLKSEIISNPTVDDIKKYLLLDIPVIVTANGHTLFKENKHFRSGGPLYHSLIILGYDDSSNQFIVHDVGTQFGAYFKYTYSTLMSSIHDLPSSGDKHEINSGNKSVLVLLK